MGQAAVPATKSHGQVADSERPGTGQDAGGAEAEQAASSERPETGRDAGGG